MRMIVIGGRGFLGSRAVSAFKNVPNIQVVVASRTPTAGSSEVHLDLLKPETFRILQRDDIVIDVGNTSIAPPDALAEYCIDNGITMIEASSDRGLIDRLIERFRSVTGKPGRLILGTGIFTGLSNLMGGHAVAQTVGCRSLQVCIESSPFSAAGSGTIALMGDGMKYPNRYVHDGKWESAKPFERGPIAKYLDGEGPTLFVAFAETPMLYASTGVPNIRVNFGPKPYFLQKSFLYTPTFILTSWLFRAFIKLYFTFLRKVVFSSRASVVRIAARAQSANQETLVCLNAQDGMAVGGFAIAAIALEIAKKYQSISKPNAVVMVDEVTDFESVVATMRTLTDEQTLGVTTRTTTKSTV